MQCQFHYPIIAHKTSKNSQNPSWSDGPNRMKDGMELGYLKLLKKKNQNML